MIGVYTNTQPTAPYRGAGRPEATYAIERVIDVAADELGIDRVELRRRNLIPPEAMPFKTGLVFTYDSGEFEKNMDRRLARGGLGRLRGAARGGERSADGCAASASPTPSRSPADRSRTERGERRDPFRRQRRRDPASWARTIHGQGHETAFRQLACDALGVAPERIRIVAGDTDAVAHGRGTFGSRSMMAGGTAL